MEAIDDYANENIARSLAYTALEQRQQHNYVQLMSMASQQLKQRMHYLGPRSEMDTKAWNAAIQWQDDNCPEVIEAMGIDSSALDRLYHSTVYYKRLDAETLHSVVEFREENDTHYVVILILEQGNGDISELKYHNTKALSQTEWDELVETWSTSVEHAERQFLAQLAQQTENPTSKANSPPEKANRPAPEGYWSGWSSDADEPHRQRESNRVLTINASGSDTGGEDEDDDDDDGYYARWSHDPGTLTPGPNDSRPSTSSSVQRVMQQELEEEYDQSHNPLYTVPSVPNLMDAHTTALAELTQMLHASLPGAATRPTVQPMTQINPLPKAISRLRLDAADPSGQGQDKNQLPGAYPESKSRTPPSFVSEADTDKAWDEQKHEASKTLLMKSLRALVRVGHLLGFATSDILDMIRTIADERESH